MTNKLQILTALTLITILLAGGLSLTPEAFSTNSWDKDSDKKDKKGGEDSNKYKDWKKENEKHDDDDDDKNNKVKICHIPPGNPDAAHTIEISEQALAAHLEHGDTLDACPDEDDDDEPANIIIIRAITDDNNKAFDLADFTISIDGVVQDLGLPIPIVPKTDHVITGAVPDGYKFVLISGDPACPVNIDGDTFSLKEGQTIVCTIYYDDLFVPGGSTGPNPTITIVNNVLSDPAFMISVSPTVGMSEMINPTTTKYTVDSHTQVTISGSDDRPILITGDGNCPENVGGFVNIESGQDITCIFSDKVTNAAGVVFRPTHVTFVPGGGEFTFSIPGGGEVTIDATSSDTILIFDPEFDKDEASSLIIVYSLVATPYDGQPIQCFSEGIVPVGSSNAFRLACISSLTADEYSLNYALINTIDLTSP